MTTSPRAHDSAMFTLTPPPSEFDEVDKTALLTCSPSLTGLCYPSPAPSQEAGRGSFSSDSINLSHEDMSFSERQHSVPQELFFGEGSDGSFMPMSSLAEQDMATFSTANSGYPMFEQNQWLSYTTSYPQPPPVTAYDHTSSTEYPPFDTPMAPAFTNLIPPTPQDIAPVDFSFNTLPSNSTHAPQLSASPAFSHNSSHNSSLSSISRSPSPSVYPLPTGTTSSGLRPTLRSNSTSSNSSLHAYGIPVTDPSSASGQPAWRCAYPGCTSRATFTRGCDLRKHYNRHSKHLFCRVDGCPQSQAAAAARSTDGSLTGGFSSKKDRARHEAKHNPGIKCEWKGPNGEDCGRIFSRMDNMKDHVRRIHKKHEQKSSRA
jgi:hypothetical protein